MEQALIGAILKENNIIPDIARIVSVRDFTDFKAASAYRLCLDRWQTGEVTDIVIASKMLKVFSGWDDPGWIAESTDIGLVSNCLGYAGEIAEKSRLKRVKINLSDAINTAIDSNDILSKIADIGIKESSKENDVTSAKDCVDKFSIMRRKGGMNGLSTGYDFLDKKYITAVPGDYWAIGAATSVGKSAFAVNMFTNLLNESDAKICMISTEMTNNQMMSRLIGCLTDIPAIYIIKNDIRDQADLERIEIAENWLSKRVFFMSEKTREISEIEGIVRGLDLKVGLDVIFVDYLQHCRSSSYKKQYDILSDVTGRLQNLSKQIESTIIGMNQLSNATARDSGGNLEFKGAGDIAADCDIGIILRKSKKDRSILNAEIKKNRHGPLGCQVLKFTKSYAILEEILHTDNW